MTNINYAIRNYFNGFLTTLVIMIICLISIAIILSPFIWQEIKNIKYPLICDKFKNFMAELNLKLQLT